MVELRDEELEYNRERKIGFTPTESDILNVFPVGKPISVKDLQMLTGKSYHVIYTALRTLEDREFIQYLETKNKIRYYIMRYTPGKLELIGKDNTRYPLRALIVNHQELFVNRKGPHTETSWLIAKIPFELVRLFYWANQPENPETKEKWKEIRKELIHTAAQIRETLETLEGIILQVNAQGDYEQYRTLFALTEEELSGDQEVIQWYKENYEVD